MADIVGRTIRVSVILKKDANHRVDTEFLKEGEDFTKEHHSRSVLGTAMASPSVLDMAGITTGKSLLLTTDRSIKVGVNSSTNLITLADNGMMALKGDFTAIYVQNTDANYEATIEFVITD